MLIAFFEGSECKTLEADINVLGLTHFLWHGMEEY